MTVSNTHTHMRAHNYVPTPFCLYIACSSTHIQLLLCIDIELFNPLHTVMLLGFTTASTRVNETVGSVDIELAVLRGGTDHDVTVLVMIDSFTANQSTSVCFPYYLTSRRHIYVSVVSICPYEYIKNGWFYTWRYSTLYTLFCLFYKIASAFLMYSTHRIIGIIILDLLRRCHAHYSHSLHETCIDSSGC